MDKKKGEAGSSMNKIELKKNLIENDLQIQRQIRSVWKWRAVEMVQEKGKESQYWVIWSEVILCDFLEHR